MSVAYIIQMYLKFVVIMEANTLNLGTACSEPLLFAIQAFKVYMQISEQMTVVGR